VMTIIAAPRVEEVAVSGASPALAPAE